MYWRWMWITVKGMNLAWGSRGMLAPPLRWGVQEGKRSLFPAVLNMGPDWAIQCSAGHSMFRSGA